jgi:hypothetical protein
MMSHRQTLGGSDGVTEQGNCIWLGSGSMRQGRTRVDCTANCKSVIPVFIWSRGPITKYRINQRSDLSVHQDYPDLPLFYRAA